MVTLNPYLNFDGQAREAITFYQSVLGGELLMSTFGENGMSQEGGESGEADKIMHAMLVAPGGLTLMASDIPEGMPKDTGSSISISLSGSAAEEDQLRGYYERLSEGGQQTLPLEQAPWGDHFGMVVDRFGTSWMVNIAGSQG